MAYRRLEREPGPLTEAQGTGDCYNHPHRGNVQKVGEANKQLQDSQGEKT